MNVDEVYNIKKGLVYAVIPARSGSKGVKDKNIKNIGGFPVIAYSIALSQLCHNIDRILVLTDSAKYAEISRKFGAETPYLRSKETSSDTAHDILFVKEAIKWLHEQEGQLPEYFVHLRPTTVFREPDIVDFAIKKIINDNNATSLRSAHNIDDCPYKWFIMTDDNYFKGIHDGITTDIANLPRQNFPKVYIPNGYVDILKTKHILEYDLLHGNKMIAYITVDTADIDLQKDFDKIKKQLTDDHIIYKFLNDKYSIHRNIEQKY